MTTPSMANIMALLSEEREYALIRAFETGKRAAEAERDRLREAIERILPQLAGRTSTEQANWCYSVLRAALGTGDS